MTYRALPRKSAEEGFQGKRKEAENKKEDISNEVRKGISNEL
jgi:hypothetical protein